MLSRYYPNDIEMHSFENVASRDLKCANWAVLERFFKVRMCGRGHMRTYHFCWQGMSTRVGCVQAASRAAAEMM